MKWFRVWVGVDYDLTELDQYKASAAGIGTETEVAGAWIVEVDSPATSRGLPSGLKIKYLQKI